MKTAEELFDKYEILAPSEENPEIFDQHTDCVDYYGFFKAIADYKQSIIGLIDNHMEHLNPYSRNETILKQVLSELKQKIEAL